MRHVALVAALLLAGCASTDPPADAGDGSVLQEAEQAAAEVEVESTPTTGVIRGFVVDEAIRPIAGVRVELEGEDAAQLTNEAGAFGFDGLPAGIYFLLSSHENYTGARHSVEVVAGVDHPEPVRILVSAIPRAAPYVEGRDIRLFQSVAVYAPVAGPYNAGVAQAAGYPHWSFLETIEANGTVAQFEYTWSKTSDFATNGAGHATTHWDEGNGRKTLHDLTLTGPNPVVLRLNASDADRHTATWISGDLRAAPSGGTPAGVMANQQFDCFVHVFHNFVPDEGWQFGRDGDHPLPGG